MDVDVLFGSSNFPRFDINTNTGEPEATARRTAVATNTVHMNAAHPSHLRVWLEDGQDWIRRF